MVVERAVEISRPLIEARRHELVESLPPGPVWLEADPVRLAQVVANLLNNAAKYTEERGRIDARRPEGGQRRGAAGPGHRRRHRPGRAAPRLRPVRAGERSLDRSQGGLGIGLTLVKSLVEMHGGSVEARSDGPGQGSEFVVRLPLAGAGAGRRHRPGAAAARAAARRLPRAGRGR